MKDILQVVVLTGAFLVLFIPLFVSDSMFFPYITGKNFAFRIIVDIVFVSWILLALLDVRYRPRFSWLLVTSGVLLVVMFFADLFGQYPVRSFWSNFERMDGYVTLVHFFLYFVVLGHMFQSEKIWTYFFNTSIGVATYVAISGLGSAEGRIVGTLGNSTYLAIYMLFNLFISANLLMNSRHNFLRALYVGLALLFVYVLLETGTRGTFVGLAVGSFSTVAYMTLFGRGYPQVRRMAIAGVVGLIICTSTFFVFRDSDFVQSNSNLARYANISLDDLTVRGTIWSMAFEGVKERPVLGWGQGGFNFVFNKYYDPSLYGQESWFDRVHNIFFDWLIAGGVLGFTAYFSILISCLYYLFWRPLFIHDEQNDDTSFRVLERALLIGILAGYFTHNLVVFDNIVSYIFYAVVLAFIHNRVSTEIPAVAALRIDHKLVTYIGVPVGLVATALVIYFVHVPGILAAQDIVDALQATSMEERFAALSRALDRDTFAQQEVTEQMLLQATAVVNSNLTVEEKNKYLQITSNALLDLAKEKPDDARVYAITSSFYRTIGQYDLATQAINAAHELSPNKQAMILTQGALAKLRGDHSAMHTYFKQAFELDERYEAARILYAASLFYTGDTEKIRELVADEYFRNFALNPFAIAVADEVDSIELLPEMLKERVAAEPTNAQYRSSLAAWYYEHDRVNEAVAVLQQAVADIPAFTPIGDCYIKNLKKGRLPDDGC